MSTIQFKRNLSFGGDLVSAIDKIKNNLNPKLQPGEPLLCSYDDNGTTKYMLAIGVNNGDIRIIPSFESIDEIKNLVGPSGNFDIDNISTSSDILAETDADGKMVLKIKDELKNIWIKL